MQKKWATDQIQELDRQTGHVRGLHNIREGGEGSAASVVKTCVQLVCSTVIYGNPGIDRQQKTLILIHTKPISHRNGHKQHSLDTCVKSLGPLVSVGTPLLGLFARRSLPVAAEPGPRPQRHCQPSRKCRVNFYGLGNAWEQWQRSASKHPQC